MPENFYQGDIRMLNTTHLQGKIQMPVPLHISIRLLATTALIKPNQF